MVRVALRGAVIGAATALVALSAAPASATPLVGVPVITPMPLGGADCYYTATGSSQVDVSLSGNVYESGDLTLTASSGCSSAYRTVAASVTISDSRVTSAGKLASDGTSSGSSGAVSTDAEANQTVFYGDAVVGTVTFIYDWRKNALEGSCYTESWIVTRVRAVPSGAEGSCPIASTLTP